MKVAPLAVLLLSICVFGQQTTTPNEKAGSVLTGDDGQPSGTIHGTAVDQSGRPAKSLRVGVIWMCPTGCSIQVSSTKLGRRDSSIWVPSIWASGGSLRMTLRPAIPSKLLASHLPSLNLALSILMRNFPWYFPLRLVDWWSI